MNLDCLHNRILSCQLCGLSRNRTHAVPGEGPCPARIMLIGEAPGAREDLSGRPFVGRAGKVLDEALAEAGLERADVFITSVVKCRPPHNRRPRKEEMDACHAYLKCQMDILKPGTVCLMGNVACQAILGRQGVASLRGQLFLDLFLVTFHPAAVLRNKNLREAFVSDLKAAKARQVL